ncbi:hypothetical protein HJC23_005424 [Cyclotella cryptica]|uniref:SLC41A/MgtE integral membrane domain-containing protein n=1 Tax=Cyclotella cryptica TaxID=29204 RepID=A0ABD3NWE4_9STRA|eukprot:CCRYP_019376-RA/>CCRYP_019376-RA protein AED:0.03 eAED:0.00 QI:0/-1/0/1/-1/1/1/0/404
MKSRASEVAKPNDTESELHLLRQQNKELQTQLKELRLHVESLNGKTLNESNRIRSPSLSNNDTFCLQNGRVSHEENFQGEERNGPQKTVSPPVAATKANDCADPTRSKATDDNIKTGLFPPSTPKKEQVPTSDVSGFSTPKQSNKKSAYESSSKDSTDRGGNYKKVFNMDEEHGSHSPESNEGTEDECDELIHDDSSHNKHQNRRSQRRARHTETFRQQVKERAGWLIGLLFLQSCSSFIIQYNERFLQSHMVIVQFLTMLVGAGGNAGNQASVRVIRGLAVGTLNDRTLRPFLKEEIKMAFGLSALLGLTGFIRAALFRTPPGETIAVTASLCAIVAISVGIGSTLPLAMKRVGIDPAHSSTTIQVVMDIMGVLITVCVSSLVMSFTVFQHDENIESGGGTTT